VLDVGYGERAELVRYLRSLDIAAYSVDRFAGAAPYLAAADWLQVPFRPAKWATIHLPHVLLQSFHPPSLEAGWRFRSIRAAIHGVVKRATGAGRFHIHAGPPVHGRISARRQVPGRPSRTSGNQALYRSRNAPALNGKRKGHLSFALTTVPVRRRQPARKVFPCCLRRWAMVLRPERALLKSAPASVAHAPTW